MRKAVVMFAIVALAAATFAQEKDPEITRVKDKLKTRSITLAMSDTSLSNVLSFLSDIAQLTFVIDSESDSDTAVTLRANNVKLETALKLILEPIEFDYMVKKGGIIFVATKKRIAELKGKGKEKKESDLKEGELLFFLKDGSKIKGKVAVDKWKLKTAYGELTIPANEIRKIRLAQEEEKKEDEEKEKKEEKDKEEKDKPEEDEVETIRFTVTGELQVEKLEIETGKGKLAIPKSDIKEILFPRPVIEKSFEVKPTGEWLDTGIKLEKDDTLKITATGQIDDEYSPDARETLLVARIGKDGKEFEVGSACMTKVKEKGRLYLSIKVAESVEEPEGSFKVKVRVQK